MLFGAYMELFDSKMQQENQYAVCFHSSKKTMKYFDDFIDIVGRSTPVSFSLDTERWQISKAAYQELIELDLYLFPAKKTAKQRMASIIAATHDDIEGAEAMGADMKLQPYPYQKEIIKFALDAESTLIVAPCGAGRYTS